MKLPVLLISLFISLQVVAVPADKRLMKVKQSNGTELSIRLYGDEHRALWTTEDGYPLLFNEITGNYEYAVCNGNTVTRSNIVATEVSQRDEASKAILSNVDKQMVVSLIANEQNNARKAIVERRKIRINDFPTIGEPHTLVILVEFDDMKFSTIGDPNDYYNRLLNEPNFTYENGANGSARDFYRMSSNGSFRPIFDVVGPVTLSKSFSFYGTDEGNEIDVNMGEFLVEACEAADDLVDFTQYDANNDGAVDNIYFFYAGYGEADSGLKSAIWPQAGTFEEWGKSVTLDGMPINSYACSQEISAITGGYYPNGIGTFVHEFGHVLGLADHYDTSYQSKTLDPESWDVMASGSYNDNQHHPPLFSAFERAELGWLDYTDIEPTTESISVEILALKNQAYRIVVPETDGNEYFILENRQRVNEFEMTLPGKGLLVWHVDMDENVWMENTVNCKTHHQHLDIVEADGMATINTLAGDAFPGPNKVRQFDFLAWNGTNLFSFLDVVETPTTIDVVLNESDDTSIKPFNYPSAHDDVIAIYAPTGGKLSHLTSGVNIIRLKDGRVKKVLK